MTRGVKSTAMGMFSPPDSTISTPGSALESSSTVRVRPRTIERTWWERQRLHVNVSEW